MDSEEIKETDAWTLYMKGQDFARRRAYYSDTDKNHRMYNGMQMKGLKAGGLEKIQVNFIKPIVKAKVGALTSNLFVINYSSENLEPEFRETGEEVCKILNRYAARIWEKRNMDEVIRKVVTESCVNDEVIIYNYFSKEDNLPEIEFLRKTDVYYGNENDSNIEKQPYIIIKQRKPVSIVKAIAEKLELGKEKLDLIVGDMETFEQAGEDAKIEVDDMCTFLTKLYKINGKVFFDQATRCVDFRKKINTGLSYYPLTHMIWEEKPGNARGEGIVRNLTATQIEVNKTVIRRLLTVENTAYPQKIVNKSKIINLKDLKKVGAVLEVNGQAVDDVRKIFNIIQPAQMSVDVEKVQNELITLSRELENAGDNVTGNVDVTKTSGRAILAVQNAAREPLNEQLTYLKTCIENEARIWFDMLVVYSKNEIRLSSEITDKNGQTQLVAVDVPKMILQALEMDVKVDISPKSSYDKFAQEQFLENMLVQGLFRPDRLPELEVFTMALDDDMNIPKIKIEKIVKTLKERQERINQIEQEAEMMKQRYMNFINTDVDNQADMINQARQQVTDENQTARSISQ